MPASHQSGHDWFEAGRGRVRNRVLEQKTFPGVISSKVVSLFGSKTVANQGVIVLSVNQDLPKAL
jgi:hypothetical protein